MPTRQIRMENSIFQPFGPGREREEGKKKAGNNHPGEGFKPTQLDSVGSPWLQLLQFPPGEDRQ